MMPNYGVLKAQVQTDNGEFTSSKTGMSHYNLITILNDQEEYQVNIDIQSDSSPNVRLYAIDNYTNPIVTQFDGLSNGFNPLVSQSGTLALDYIRETLFDITQLENATPISAEGLSTTLDKYLENQEYVVVFGTMYSDQDSDKSSYGHRRYQQNNSLPSQGVHNVHYNQGSVGEHTNDNGIYQDGALFVKMPDASYSAFFFAFSEQCFNTDTNGDCINQN
jgi:uncharacterized protein YukJ